MWTCRKARGLPSQSARRPAPKTDRRQDVVGERFLALRLHLERHRSCPLQSSVSAQETIGLTMCSIKSNRCTLKNATPRPNTRCMPALRNRPLRTASSTSRTMSSSPLKLVMGQPVNRQRVNSERTSRVVRTLSPHRRYNMRPSVTNGYNTVYMPIRPSYAFASARASYVCASKEVKMRLVGGNYPYLTSDNLKEVEFFRPPSECSPRAKAPSELIDLNDRTRSTTRRSADS
jgi:hypothetical protein